ncbi:hypothetical protein PR003_g7216 [Phytophthora rubi]|uniref:Uncharacterized protein n=1 Tax=Phytophthora rubi TaxID=129364 RepID=A0A6A4G0K6_9STRA|nr:hypothetical protein PR002_g7219 [Phytophthora rubi]KAE9040725.1 hypothetical protein PR001_g6930 [Phytophthora rubi]KAE9346855.1 hypothetical protein PR003_g7216 [Phytophthora rubi]
MRPPLGAPQHCLLAAGAATPAMVAEPPACLASEAPLPLSGRSHLIWYCTNYL